MIASWTCKELTSLVHISTIRYNTLGLLVCNDEFILHKLLKGIEMMCQFENMFEV